MNIAVLVLVFIAALCVMMVLIQQKRSETFLTTPPRPSPMPSPRVRTTTLLPPPRLPPPRQMPSKDPEAMASDFRTGYDDMFHFVPSPDAPDRKTFKVNTENPCDPYGTGTCFTRQ